MSPMNPDLGAVCRNDRCTNPIPDRPPGSRGRPPQYCGATCRLDAHRRYCRNYVRDVRASPEGAKYLNEQARRQRRVHRASYRETEARYRARNRVQIRTYNTAYVRRRRAQVKVGRARRHKYTRWVRVLDLELTTACNRARRAGLEVISGLKPEWCAWARIVVRGTPEQMARADQSLRGRRKRPNDVRRGQPVGSPI
jgi:hypothetical protein